MTEIKDLIQKTQHLSILFVDDEEDIRDSVKSFFNKFVKKFFLASNGEEGLKTFKEENIDVIITDIVMPKMDGLKMIEEIKKINPKVFIIIISATDNNIINENTSYNLRIKKPILFEDIEKILKSISQL
ncbi:MAG: hypothetical protein C0625_16780 [Arcobacter sp.]|nr:MAG: hypothetical protein C0625_16780 [Arcobacter sp.]